jgi:pyruvate/2-oxoacid:ferredoxin oxidoreductase beta subunit
MCQDDRETREALGCDTPAQAAVWGDDEDEFFNCPIRWLGSNTSSWYDRYRYYQESGRWPEYETVNNRFWEAVLFYKSECVRFSQKLTKQNRPISNNLRAMRQPDEHD